MGLWAVGLSPEIVNVVEADALLNAEGETRAHGGVNPRTSALWLHRGLRPGHGGKGCPGTWEVSRPPARSWERRCEESEHHRGREKSECRRRSEEVGEPTRGTLRSKGRHREESEPLKGTRGETPSSPTL